MTCPHGHSRAFTQLGLAIYDCHDCNINGYTGRFFMRLGKSYCLDKNCKGTDCKEPRDDHQ